ncbi:type I-F CRISPR-associated endoribonuclease Cas6/Csy4 [Parasphaerochaeta coccoides]|uniref:CRISPR-associated protein, Csy4 family n=1 Tax=Parasphaerochaeta coccoides (strain ATCC BAA-1237 / DSM 17374 / SPN1) TaxID=760011 RepID=F4GL26_PARC1|nr:type I-F CRISPR-associated endoribonuclease Cas6/Csy4 [Parasphaerochaeta coccoides]AEC02366.1 CRISPR-associated protein, Csy4 family [Parasphaerochaeta coccoides DSM 17374]
MKYVEITLLPGIEVPLPFLWKKIFMRLHLRFVGLQDAFRTVPYGVSFPGYAENPLSVGSKLRVFAESEQNLISLDAKRTFADFADYVHVTGIGNIPDGCTYALYKRLQPNGNLPKIARRKASREGLSYDEALARLKVPGSNKSSDNLFPYIYMKSLSSHQDFCLFIKKELAEVSREFSFSTYGLSAICTVPEF